MKKWQEHGATSSTTPIIEAQLNHLIAAITTTTDATTEQMKKQETYGFGEVRTHLDSLFDVVMTKELKAYIADRICMIDTRRWIRNVKILSHAIKTNNEDLNTSLW